MAKIQYRKYSFQSPARISEAQYLSIKQQLKVNPTIEVFHTKSFTEHFKIQLWLISGCTILFFLFLIIDIKDGNPLMVIMGLCPLIVAINIIYLFLEGPSYATYVKASEEYFERMRYAIINTNNYTEFLRIFYNA